MLHFCHSSYISEDLINLILLPINPFFDRKNNVDGFALANSSIPITVKFILGLSYISLFISNITFE